MDWLSIALKFWPLIAVTAVFTIVGQFFSTRVFTKERAYDDYGRDRLGRSVKWFMWWGRETLPLHPIAAGFALGKKWVDPFAMGWDSHESQWAFALCGFASLGVWIVLKSRAKKLGIVLELPGETIPPPPPGVDDETVPYELPDSNRLDP